MSGLHTEVLLTEQQLRARICDLGQQITADYDERYRNLSYVGVLPS